MLSVEDWAEIRRLHRAEAMPIKAIARVVGVSKNTVKAALRSDGPPKYERGLRGSLVDAVEPRLRELLQAYPTMPAPVIVERIGWQHSIRILRDRVGELRAVYLPPDPASRTTYVAGDVAQCDFWLPPIELSVGFGQVRGPKNLPVLTMVTGYSLPRRALGCAPSERIEADRHAMLALPPVPPQVGWRISTRLGRDHHVRLDGNGARSLAPVGDPI